MTDLLHWIVDEASRGLSEGESIDALTRKNLTATVGRSGTASVPQRVCRNDRRTSIHQRRCHVRWNGKPVVAIEAGKHHRIKLADWLVRVFG